MRSAETFMLAVVDDEEGVVEGMMEGERGENGEGVSWTGFSLWFACPFLIPSQQLPFNCNTL